MEQTGHMRYELALTNKEVHVMFENMIQDWFSGNDDYNDFIRALLMDDLKAMNIYMNRSVQKCSVVLIQEGILRKKSRNAFIMALCLV